MAADQSIVIKKIKKGAHAAHGGAWKVAYADFVTAMMAFFLLLWLLNATEAEKLAGLADYFAPTVGVQGNMGIGFRGGKGPISKGIGADKSTNRGIIFAAPTAGTVVKNPEIIDQENDLPDEEKIQIITEEAKPDETLEEVQENIEKALEQETSLGDLRGNIFIQNTPEGLKIQIIDQDKRPMFKQGDVGLSPDAEIILRKVAEIVNLLPNTLSIVGHTNTVTLGRGKNYTNWELSADRANFVRRFLIDAGIVNEQISNVAGKADHEPLNPFNPESTLNNRIDIILLRNDRPTRHIQGVPEEIFVDPKSVEKEEMININSKGIEDKNKAEEKPVEEIPVDVKAEQEAQQQAKDKEEQKRNFFKDSERGYEDLLKSDELSKEGKVIGDDRGDSGSGSLPPSFFDSLGSDIPLLNF